MTKNRKLRGLLAMVSVAALLLTTIPLWVGMWVYAEGGNTSPKVFTADFAELAMIAKQEGKLTDEVTEYATTSEDTALNDWVSERFILRYGREHGTQVERPYLGASSEDFDPVTPSDASWQGESKWLIKSDGYLKRYVKSTGDQMLRKWDSLVVKGENGKAIPLQNFETSFTVNQEFASYATNNKAGRGAVVFGFRQDALDIGEKSTTAQRSMVVIGKGGDDWNTPTKTIGISVLSDTEISTSGVYKNTATEIADLEQVEEFRVTVRVVGTDCTVTITPPEGGTPYYTQQVTLPNAAAGYISYGVTGSRRSLGNITLTQLDEDGNAVDFGYGVQTYKKLQFSIRDLVPYGNGGYQPVGWGPTTWYPFYNESIEIANTFRTYINTHFAMYNNLNGQCTTAEMTKDVDCFGAALENVWLQRALLFKDISDTRTLGRITSLVYKDATSGNLAKYYNFETEFLFRLDATQGGIVLGFRQQTPGMFTVSETAVNKEQGFVAITAAGVTVAAGDTITDSMYDGVTTSFTEALPTKKQLLAQIRVVNDTCKVTIRDANAALLFTQIYTIDFDTAGYLAYGVSAKAHAFADISLTHLDDEGNPIDIGRFTSKEDGSAFPGIPKIYDFTDEAQLNDFHSYFVPIAFSGYDIIDSNENSEWALENGKLKYNRSQFYQADSVYRSKEGVDIAGSHYQCDWVYGWNANFGVLMLEKQRYKNFIMTVEFEASDPYWPVVGFGAGGTDTSDVFCTQEDGGYAVLIEQNGRTKLWGWQAYKKNSNDPHFNYLMDAYVNSSVHRLQLIVNEGVLYVYLDNYEEPIVHTLPSTYDGGYVYLATNSNGLRFNSLSVTNLDNANIEVASAKLETKTVTVNRAAGETLQLPACAQITGVNGYNYMSPIVWECEDYRSYKEGTFTFTGTVALTGTIISENSDLSALSIQVQNNINGDYDTDTSVKYYFDTTEDLRDFTTYANEKVSYDGALAEATTSEHWTVSDGKLLRKIDGAISSDPTYNDEALTKNVSSIILNARDGDQLTLMNFQLDLEYRLAQDSWLWPMVAIGVNDPEQFITKQTSATAFTMQKTGGGMYIFTERESPIQARGAVYNADSERFTGSSFLDANGNLFSTSFDKTKTHHMRIRVYDGTAYISVDGSQEVVVNIDASAWGGYIGFVVQDASVTFDNLTVTALNSDGEVVPLSEAETGFSPKNQVDTYLGWTPTYNEWYYEWSSDYN